MSVRLPRGLPQLPVQAWLSGAAHSNRRGSPSPQLRQRCLAPAHTHLPRGSAVTSVQPGRPIPRTVHRGRETRRGEARTRPAPRSPAAPGGMVFRRLQRCCRGARGALCLLTHLPHRCNRLVGLGRPCAATQTKRGILRPRFWRGPPQKRAQRGLLPGRPGPCRFGVSRVKPVTSARVLPRLANRLRWEMSGMPGLVCSTQERRQRHKAAVLLAG